MLTFSTSPCESRTGNRTSARCGAVNTSTNEPGGRAASGASDVAPPSIVVVMRVPGGTVNARCAGVASWRRGGRRRTRRAGRRARRRGRPAVALGAQQALERQIGEPRAQARRASGRAQRALEAAPTRCGTRRPRARRAPRPRSTPPRPRSSAGGRTARTRGCARRRAAAPSRARLAGAPSPSRSWLATTASSSRRARARIARPIATAPIASTARGGEPSTPRPQDRRARRGEERGLARRHRLAIERRRVSASWRRAPQQIARPAHALPLGGGLLDAHADRVIGGVALQPALQRRPAREQRLVRDLVGAVLRVVGDHDAAADQRLERGALVARSSPESAARPRCGAPACPRR